MSRHLISASVVMEWPGLTVSVGASFPLDPPESWTPSQLQAEIVYRALCEARSKHNAPDELPDIRLAAEWAESWECP